MCVLLRNRMGVAMKEREGGFVGGDVQIVSCRGAKVNIQHFCIMTALAHTDRNANGI